MRESIVGSMLACQETMDRRPNTFEIYGCDFIIAEDFRPWMLEINACPDLSSSTSVTARMCPQFLEDVIKGNFKYLKKMFSYIFVLVVIDRRKDPKADVGMFELIYKQNMPRAPAYLGMSLCVRGRKLFKTKKYKNREDNQKKPKKDIDVHKQNTDILPKYVTTIMSPNLYKGPVIHDLIEELNTMYDSNDNDNSNGVDFASPVHIPPPPKKKNIGTKGERVSKRASRLKKQTNDLNFVNRKSSANENKLQATSAQKNRKRLVKSNYVSLFTEWHAKTSESNEKSLEFWERNTASILKGKNILTKLNFDTLENTLNKCDKTQNCLSSLSWNSILPALNNNNVAKKNKNFLTVGMSLQNVKNSAASD